MGQRAFVKSSIGNSAVQITSTSCKGEFGLWFSSDDASPDTLYIDTNSSVAATTGLIINPGQSRFVPTVPSSPDADVSSWYVIAASGSTGVISVRAC